jgi:glycine/D-amino acid oxidase-like deaminating enzyme
VIDLGRRRLLQSSLASGLLAACAGPQVSNLPPIRARTDRVVDITVCLRPFRAAGPRLDAELLGDTLVVHNYGHGGSGWSLSWGSAAIAVGKAMQASPTDIAVIGCGALGLTAAITAQRAGAKVTIYAAEQLPQTRSARASGAWTPDSRIALASVAGPGFATLWEGMARSAYATHRGYISQPGTPVEWADFYSVVPENTRPATPRLRDGLDFAHYGNLIADLAPKSVRLEANAAPFRAAAVSKSEFMIFNITEYAETLMSAFLAAGGVYRHAEFEHPSQIIALGHKVVINCTGYGARALWRDDSVVPVRGQTTHLIAQPEVRYGLFYDYVYVVPRRDGIVVQAVEGGDMKGYGDTNETVDRAESDRAVTTLAELFRPPLWRGAPMVS